MSYFLEAVLDFIVEVFCEQFCGFIGKWFWRIVTLGRTNPDSRSSGMIITGLTMIIALAGLVFWLSLK